MKKLINSIKNKCNSAIISARTAIESTSGEGYIDTGVKIIIGVVTKMIFIHVPDIKNIQDMESLVSWLIDLCGGINELYR